MDPHIPQDQGTAMSGHQPGLAAAPPTEPALPVPAVPPPFAAAAPPLASPAPPGASSAPGTPQPAGDASAARADGMPPSAKAAGPPVAAGQAAQEELAAAPAAASSPAGLPLAAADGDIIEREWVTRVKKIIADTRHDPFKQVRELNILKAEYMKKRYNKDLKLPDA